MTIKDDEEAEEAAQLRRAYDEEAEEAAQLRRAFIGAFCLLIVLVSMVVVPFLVCLLLN